MWKKQLVEDEKMSRMRSVLLTLIPVEMVTSQAFAHKLNFRWGLYREYDLVVISLYHFLNIYYALSTKESKIYMFFTVKYLPLKNYNTIGLRIFFVVDIHVFIQMYRNP